MPVNPTRAPMKRPVIVNCHVMPVSFRKRLGLVRLDEDLGHLRARELGRRELALRQHLAHLGPRQENVVVAAGTSSDLVSPTSGWIRSPSTVSSAPLVRYSCARWIGLRVWKPTTRFQPRSAKVRRVSAGSSASSGKGGVARSKTVTLPAR